MVDLSNLNQQIFFMGYHNCLNCGRKIPHNSQFCPHCGQRTTVERLTWRVLVHELLQFLTHIEDTFLQTSWLMLVKPGHVISEYLKGRRKLYYTPLSFYLLWITINMVSLRVIVNMFGYAPVPMAGINGDTPEQVIAIMKTSHLSFLFCLPLTTILNYFIMGKSRLYFFESFALSLYMYGTVFMGLSVTTLVAGSLFKINVIGWQFFLFQVAFSTSFTGWIYYHFFKSIGVRIKYFMARLVIFVIVDVVLVAKLMVTMNAVWIKMGL